jgi:GNAT superfamily N-acetyltransferase
VAAIAAQAFSGYLGHYHADLRLNRADCDAVYVSWAERSCTVPGVADAVLLAEYESQVMGFVTVKRTTEVDAEVPLYGVGSEWQRRGLGKALIAGACRWAHEQGATRMWISTQVTNIASQKIWSGLGLRLDHSYYTFHKWFD